MNRELILLGTLLGSFVGDNEKTEKELQHIIGNTRAMFGKLRYIATTSSDTYVW